MCSVTIETDDDPDMEADVPLNVKNVFINLKEGRTQDSLVKNQLERLFNVKTFEGLITEVNLCRLKLARSGIFKNIDLLIDVSDSGNSDDFDVYCKLKEVGKFSAQAGYDMSTEDKNVSFSGKMTNLRGDGEILKMKTSRGTNLKSSYDFSWSKPSLQNTDRLFTLTASKSVTDVVPSFFTETMHGLGASLAIPGPLGIHTLGWGFHWRENSIVSSAPFEIREQCGHSLKSAIRHSFVSDGRNDWIIPTHGHLFKHNIEYSGVGGDVKAIKTDVEIQLNKEIFSDCVVSGSIRAGGVRSLSNTPLLINDRYFLGGPESVRGFFTRGIGQHADQASLGGELFWESGLHLYTPLPYRVLTDSLRLHFFANAGNVQNFENLSPKDFLLKPRCSIGIGLMMMIAGFRLELNYCWPKNERPGDVINPGLQVGVGMDFL